MFVSDELRMHRKRVTSSHSSTRIPRRTSRERSLVDSRGSPLSVAVPTWPRRIPTTALFQLRTKTCHEPVHRTHGRTLVLNGLSALLSGGEDLQMRNRALWNREKNLLDDVRPATLA